MTTHSNPPSLADPNQAPSLERVARVLSETRVKLEELHRRRTEPIAIIGAGCRLPGAENPRAFWTNLAEGQDAMREVPPQRWDVEEFYDPVPHTPGKMYVREGGFLEDLERWDPDFFGTAPELFHDPHQRLLLEVAWEALEHACLPPDQLPTTSTGVYFGTGSPNGGAAAGRISNFFSLEGPCMHIDSGCSSTLVATHLACQALRAGECDVAIVGGLNLILSPQDPIQRCAQLMLSPDSRCRAFDASAQGSAQGEGCAVLVLKRASDAKAAHDPILALVRGSAINHDGSSVALGAPSKGAQMRLFQLALQNAGVSAEEVGYVEAHASGSVISDCLELEALAAVYGRDREEPLLVGSVKTNLGSLEAAAGITALLKAALCVNHAMLPPHLHFQEPNPYFPWSSSALSITERHCDWPGSYRLRRAGVSTFSVTGSNAHVLVEEPQTPALPKSPELERELFLLSAKTSGSLAELVGRYLSWLDDHSGASLSDICYTTQVGRTHHQQRLAWLVDSREGLLERLQGYTVEEATEVSSPRLGFLFSGSIEGSTWVASLYEDSHAFRTSLDQDAASRDRLLAGEPDAVGAFMLGNALSSLWTSLGIEPAFVVGQGVGEYTAAVAAGVFSVSEGLALLKAGDQEQRQAVANNLSLKSPDWPIFVEEVRADEAVIRPSYWVSERVPSDSTNKGPGAAEMHLDLGPRFQIWESLQELYLAGFELDWSALRATNPQGKLRLPTYAFARTAVKASQATARPPFVSPQTALQKLVTGLWEELLEAPKVGMMDNFFFLGGHSLLAAQMVRRLQDMLGLALSPLVILESPTVEGLAKQLRELHGNLEDLEKTAAVWLHVGDLTEEQAQRRIKSLE